MATDDAPGELELVRSFINTAEPVSDMDELRTPEEMTRWLAEHDLLDGGTRLSRRDQNRAARFREALRGLLLANSGESVPPGAVDELNQLAAGGGLAMSFSGDGTAELTPTGAGIGAAIGRLAAIVGGAMADGTWARLKVCRAEDCEWAFYDRSRNRSGTWCDMAACGNRAKVRSYRERHAR
jgi:predicted RNA-binding Zn ribbon-like protein